ncbi:MAG: hypothetical protein ABI895_11540 [Deltaproteobacteria bacterium]
MADSGDLKVGQALVGQMERLPSDALIEVAISVDDADHRECVVDAIQSSGGVIVLRPTGIGTRALVARIPVGYVMELARRGDVMNIDPAFENTRPE